VASASAFALHPLSKLEENMQIYTKGMGDSNIMMMCLIFILAGAFASVAKATGAVDKAKEAVDMAKGKVLEGLDELETALEKE
jgi:Na+/H+ antiporter NhaC